MRIFPYLLELSLVTLALCAPAAGVAGDRWESDYPENDEFTQSYTREDVASITVNDIAGPVTLTASDGPAIQVRVVRTAPTIEELAKRRILVEKTGTDLWIHTEQIKGMHWGHYNVRQRVELSVPPNMDVRIYDIAGRVKIERIDGGLQINDIAGPLDIENTGGSPRIYDIAGSVRIGVTSLAGQGLRINDIAGAVEVSLGGVVAADISIEDLSGHLTVDLPSANVLGKLRDGTYRGQIGGGGPPISISDIAGSVTVRAR